MGYLTGKVTPTTEFPDGDLREMFLRFPPGGDEGRLVHRRAASDIRQGEECNTGKDRFSMMAKKTFDVSMIGDDFLQNVRFRVNVLRYSF